MKHRRRTQTLASRARQRWARKGEGFTLVELMIGLLILGIILAALAPAYYGLLKASSSTNQRSVANGLAVSATEQLRSYPYYQVGYYAGTIPAHCPTSTTPPVILDPAVPQPLGSLPISKTISHITYTIQRCVNWVDATVAGNTKSFAYKQAIVTVSWPSHGSTLSISQTSALYPGGQGLYTGPKSDYIPGGTATTVPTTPPAPPTNVTATVDSGAPTSLIDVSWIAPTTAPAPDYYVVFYTTTDPHGASIPSLGAGAYAASPNVSGLSSQITVGAGTRYYFQVASVTSGVASTGISNTDNAKTASGTTTTTSTTLPGSTTSTTAPATTTTTAPPVCSIDSLVVTPPSDGNNGGGNNGSGVPVHGDGTLVNGSSFGLAVNASAACSNVTVGYAPSTCTPGNGTCATTYAPMTGSGTLFGTAGIASTVWTVGTQIFTVFVGTSHIQYQPATLKQVIVCAEKVNGSGKGTGAC
jgi:prepilin-type N-terminal cleavage/methylation domain-containing protein